MTKEDIIKLAKEAGFTDADDDCEWITDGIWDKEFCKFAELIAAAERQIWQDKVDTLFNLYTHASQQRDELIEQQRMLSIAIRARGQG